jgi:hypothetical protein
VISQGKKLCRKVAFGWRSAFSAAIKPSQSSQNNTRLTENTKFAKKIQFAEKLLLGGAALSALR